MVILAPIQVDEIPIEPIIYPASETPINFPIPNVMAAAIRPNNTCRNPEYQILFPVNNVMADPIKNNPMALAATLIKMAVTPV